ncbi:MAG: hypothetical protein UT05_C0007G0015 [Parcubacteria group bacterium GW2011_GWF2_38_76]|nr:MAG: hypothetical protein UT05_C0007G0015 [Parcubacteria group bacterium GW2011_GWF2_38_76]HBM46110.1 hypothetical protein [Patescibacteria group bacterium]
MQILAIIVPVYLYGVVILTQYGYNSYFNIPSSFIDYSIKENFVFFYGLFNLILIFLGTISWWTWLFVVLLVFFSYIFYFEFGKIIKFTTIFLLLYALYSSYNFGYLLAENSSEFNTLTDSCSLLKDGNSYIIPNFYQGKAILASINSENKLIGEVSIKDLSDINCSIQKKYTGPIKR